MRGNEIVKEQREDGKEESKVAWVSHEKQLRQPAATRQPPFVGIGHSEAKLWSCEDSRCKSMTYDELTSNEDHEVLLTRLGRLSVSGDDLVLDLLEGKTLFEQKRARYEGECQDMETETDGKYEHGSSKRTRRMNVGQPCTLGWFHLCPRHPALWERLWSDVSCDINTRSAPRAASKTSLCFIARDCTRTEAEITLPRDKRKRNKRTYDKVLDDLVTAEELLVLPREHRYRPLNRPTSKWSSIRRTPGISCVDPAGASGRDRCDEARASVGIRKRESSCKHGRAMLLLIRARHRNNGKFGLLT